MKASFFGAKVVICPACKVAAFVQDEPWKLVCLACYLDAKSKRKGAAPATKPVQPRPPALEPDMLKRILYLVHPDKHGNSEAANIATRYLLELRAKS